MSIATFDELRDAIIDYAHAPHLGQRTEDFFIELATLRIGRDLKSLSNEKTEPFPAATSPLTLPLDFGQVRNVQFTDSRGPRILESRSVNTLWPLQRGASRQPLFYAIQNGSIIIAPAQQGDYEVNYYSIPELSASSPEDPALTAFPMVFLYAGLLELHVWTGDAPARQQALDFYTSEIKVINKQQARARADNPAGVAVPW